ncbi:MAG: hypothetical protein JWO05_3024 [Gemmatimonadetes bacterium]|nr:hypothetical protein [Gemmatimonadota bacterium]
MSEPRPFYARPGIVLSVLAALVLAVALVTPEDAGGPRTSDSRLSTNLAGPNGARLLYELSLALGWKSERRTEPDVPADSNVIHAVLAPPLRLTAGEAHELLERVRAGAALLFVVEGRDALADSLHVKWGDGDNYQPAAGIDAGGRADCGGRDRSGAAPMWSDWQPHLYRLAWKGPAPAALTVFAEVSGATDNIGEGEPGNRAPAAAGFEYGRGRVVVVSDPDLLRTDVLRVCGWRTDVVAVRMLEFLSARGSATPRSRLVFDEYHQGFGSQASTTRAIRTYLFTTASGRALTTLLLAALAWLLVLAPRPLPPTDRTVIERRSPLEHVAALATAYDQVGATRTAVLRLLRGVRRRTQRGTSNNLSDTDFLDWAQERKPALAPDIVIIRQALAQPVPRAKLASVGEALDRLESSLATHT